MAIRYTDPAEYLGAICQDPIDWSASVEDIAYCAIVECSDKHAEYVGDHDEFERYVAGLKSEREADDAWEAEQAAKAVA